MAVAGRRVDAAVEECKVRKSDTLLIDTLGQFTGVVVDIETPGRDEEAASAPLDAGGGGSASMGVLRLLRVCRSVQRRLPPVRLSR
jgi:hypothetical protein